MNQREKVDIAILCPIRLEFEKVREHLLEPQPMQESVYGLHYDLGHIKTKERKWKIALFETESGVANLEVKTTKIIHSLAPGYVFLVGIAGGIKDVEIGDVVIATKAYGYESGKETESGFRSRPESRSHPQKLIDPIKQLARDYQRQSGNYRIYFGPIASGQKVLANLDSATIQLIKEYYNDTLAVEMESIGFSKAALDEEVKSLNIRGISDLIDGKLQTETDGSRELAASNAADFMLQIINHLPKASIDEKVIPSPGEQIKVRYRERLSSLVFPRYSKKGVLSFHSNSIEFQSLGAKVFIQKILGIERCRMPGDLRPSWVKVRFQQEAKEKILFFSNTKLPGWANLVGGSKDLYQRFENFAQQKALEYV